VEPQGLIIASLVVRGQRLNWSAVDRVFGIKSTATWKCRPSIAAQLPELDAEEWIFELPPQPCFSFSDAIDPLIAKVQPRFNQIVVYCQEHNLDISFHLRLRGRDDSFIMGFDRSTSIKNMAILNAEMFIYTEDLQCLNSYEEDA
jgi:hypothetical protein